MILCCGEALIDFLPRETRDGALAFQPFAGGSVFNTAVALGRLNVPVGFFGGLSTDFFGDQLREALMASRVDFSFSPVSERYTILAFVKLMGAQARYSFIDEGSACRMIAESDLPSFGSSVAAIHMGSFPLIGEPCGSTLEALCRREHERRVIHFDPNIRPTLVKDRDTYLSRIARIAAMADIIKLSDEDLAWIAGGTSADEFAKMAIDRGAKLVVMTRGPNGAVAFTRHYRCDVPGRGVRVADTVGAGDTFSAGFLTALWRSGRLSKSAIAGIDESGLHDALSLATWAAAITVSRPGADPPWAHELEGVAP
jgi:fructokinase